jgi:multiple sugar transport system substrate-binding protein
VKAKEDFPELYKRTWHAGYPAGPAATGAWELNLTHGILSYSKNREAAEAFLLWLMQPKQYEAWMTACWGNNMGPTPYFERAAIWGSDSILTPLKDVPKTVRHYGYPGPPSRAAAEAVAKFIVVDMFAKACQGIPAKEAVAWAERELRQIAS